MCFGIRTRGLSVFKMADLGGLGEDFTVEVDRSLGGTGRASLWGV